MNGLGLGPHVVHFLFNRVLEVASGDPSKSEAQGLGDHEFIPWQVGAVM